MRHVTTAGAVALLLVLAGCNGEDEETAAQPDAQEQEQQQEEAADVEVQEGEGVEVEEVEDPPDDAGPPPEDAEPPPGSAEQQPWTGPSEDEIGADVAFDPIVFRNDEAVVAITGMTVYREGADVRVAVREQPDAIDEESLDDDPLRLGAGPTSTPPEADDPEVLDLVVTYPDGSTTSTAAPPHSVTDMTGTEAPEGPVLIHGMSQSTPGAWDYELWLWPLPEPGDEPLTITAEWAAQGIEGTAELDMEEVTAASDRVIELWAD